MSNISYPLKFWSHNPKFRQYADVAKIQHPNLQLDITPIGEGSMIPHCSCKHDELIFHDETLGCRYSCLSCEKTTAPALTKKDAADLWAQIA